MKLRKLLLVRADDMRMIHTNPLRRSALIVFACSCKLATAVISSALFNDASLSASNFAVIHMNTHTATNESLAYIDTQCLETPAILFSSMDMYGSDSNTYQSNTVSQIRLQSVTTQYFMILQQ